MAGARWPQARQVQRQQPDAHLRLQYAQVLLLDHAHVHYQFGRCSTVSQLLALVGEPHCLVPRAYTAPTSPKDLMTVLLECISAAC